MEVCALPARRLVGGGLARLKPSERQWFEMASAVFNIYVRTACSRPDASRRGEYSCPALAEQ